MNLPVIPTPWMVALKAIPTWVYVGAGASVVALAALGWASHKGAARQAQVDAPVIATARADAAYSSAASGLTTNQLSNTSQRASAEAHVRESTDGHVQKVQDAGDARAAFSEFLSGLHDGATATPPASEAPGVPGGPGATKPPGAAR